MAFAGYGAGDLGSQYHGCLHKGKLACIIIITTTTTTSIMLRFGDVMNASHAG